MVLWLCFLKPTFSHHWGAPSCHPVPPTPVQRGIRSPSHSLAQSLELPDNRPRFTQRLNHGKGSGDPARRAYRNGCSQMVFPGFLTVKIPGKN